MISKHTQRPWSYHIGDDYTSFYDGDNKEMFTVNYQMPEAAARLIASAPKMHKFIADFVKEAEQGYTQHEIKRSQEWPLKYVRKFRKILEEIAKATEMEGF